MMEPEDKPVPSAVSLRKVAEEIDLLFNDAWTAYLNRRTGELYTVTEEGSLDDPDDSDLPDWQREDLAKSREVMDSPDWIALPSKFDIHDYDIMARFCLDLPDGREREALLDAIHGSGAFRRFKGLVHRYGIQQHWYDFRDREIERIVADWLDTQGIPYER